MIRRTKELGFCGEQADDELAIDGAIRALDRLDHIEPSLVRQREKLVHPSVVLDRPGRAVAATCAISGCHYAEFEEYEQHSLDVDELEDLLDLIQRMIDGEPKNPDVQAWLPTLRKLQAQRDSFTP